MAKTPLQQVLGQWPLATVLTGVAAGLIVVATSHWRMGCLIIGAAITLGALLRLMPDRLVGLLRVRNRVLDFTILILLGLGIIIFALIVPPSRG
ncbi:MAG: DUF3017 domain-containing protein [Propionibacteriaceae bacterium]|jgi:hypothetical protein|nr:DUF3017 domain-containing protein [Propionibacteriaceae bacterium]